ASNSKLEPQEGQRTSRPDEEESGRSMVVWQCGQTRCMGRLPVLVTDRKAVAPGYRERGRQHGAAWPRRHPIDLGCEFRTVVRASGPVATAFAPRVGNRCPCRWRAMTKGRRLVGDRRPLLLGPLQAPIYTPDSGVRGWPESPAPCAGSSGGGQLARTSTNEVA